MQNTNDLVCYDINSGIIDWVEWYEMLWYKPDYIELAECQDVNVKATTQGPWLFVHAM